jgi:hypothetical protein
MVMKAVDVKREVKRRQTSCNHTRGISQSYIVEPLKYWFVFTLRDTDFMSQGGAAAISALALLYSLQVYSHCLPSAS